MIMTMISYTKCYIIDYLYILLTYMMKMGLEAPLTGAKEEKSKGGVKYCS